jgi:hypothetical protein
MKSDKTKRVKQQVEWTVLFYTRFHWHEYGTETKFQTFICHRIAEAKKDSADMTW